jgi:hypothetical protein
MRKATSKPQAGFAVPRGSRLLAPPADFDACQPNTIGILEVSGNPSTVQRNVLRGDPTSLQERVGRREVVQAMDENTTSILVDGKYSDRPLMFVEVCSD